MNGCSTGRRKVVDAVERNGMVQAGWQMEDRLMLGGLSFMCFLRRKDVPRAWPPPQPCVTNTGIRRGLEDPDRVKVQYTFGLAKMARFRGRH
jgi:hypothetical protein